LLPQSKQWNLLDFQIRGKPKSKKESAKVRVLNVSFRTFSELHLGQVISFIFTRIEGLIRSAKYVGIPCTLIKSVRFYSLTLWSFYAIVTIFSC